MNKESAQAKILQIIYSVGCIWYYFSFITKQKCLIKEPGEVYPSGVGIEKWEVGTSVMVSCYTNWVFSFPIILPPLGLIYLLWKLQKDTADKTKTTVFFVIFAVISFGLLDFTIAADGYNYLLK